MTDEAKVKTSNPRKTPYAPEAWLSVHTGNLLKLYYGDFKRLGHLSIFIK